MTKNITVRLPDDLATDAEALARVQGTSMNEVLCTSLREVIERKRGDNEFKYRLQQIIEKDQELLNRLAQ
ncbi:MAG TPA: hypothetical protein VIJ40_11225 [Acidimicrobiales bacterium]